MSVEHHVTVAPCSLVYQGAATVYPSLPYPESQLVSLAHSLVARGIIDETELKQRLKSIRERLEA